MHNAALAALHLDWVYVPFQVEPSDIAAAVAAVRALGMVGVNITVPLKELVAPYLDEVDSAAKKIGAVNTIVNRGGRLVGYSTDGPGILWDLERRGINVSGRPVLVWGAGGSARAVAFALASIGCRVTIANRTVTRARALADMVGENAEAIGYEASQYRDRVAGAALLVNTTTLGMAPDHADLSPPIPPAALTAGQTVYDLVYSPETTALLSAAGRAGCRAVGGLGMLVCQGAVSLSLWTGLPLAGIPVDAMFDALRR
jgi:shikimate dehydrogenase